MENSCRDAISRNTQHDLNLRRDADCLLPVPLLLLLIMLVLYSFP
jgi:hypothetical protein